MKTTSTLAACAVALCAGSTAFAEDITLGGVVFQADTFMQTFQDGMQAAEDEQGLNLILANSETDLAKESNIFNDLIVREIDALIINTLAVCPQWEGPARFLAPSLERCSSSLAVTEWS